LHVVVSVSLQVCPEHAAGGMHKGPLVASQRALSGAAAMHAPSAPPSTDSHDPLAEQSTNALPTTPQAPPAWAKPNAAHLFDCGSQNRPPLESHSAIGSSFDGVHVSPTRAGVLHAEPLHVRDALHGCVESHDAPGPPVAPHVPLAHTRPVAQSLLPAHEAPAAARAAHLPHVWSAANWQ
jgi:hypothetical protein